MTVLAIVLVSLPTTVTMPEDFSGTLDDERDVHPAGERGKTGGAVADEVDVKPKRIGDGCGDHG